MKQGPTVSFPLLWLQAVVLSWLMINSNLQAQGPCPPGVQDEQCFCDSEGNVRICSAGQSFAPAPGECSDVDCTEVNESPPSTTSSDSLAMEVGDPVSAATGEYSFNRLLLDLGGPLPLTFRLYYGSQADVKQGLDGLPFRFYSNQTLRLTHMKFLEPDEVFVDLGLGREVGFIRTQGGWQVFSFEGIIYQLQETADFFYFLDPIGGLVYTFQKEIESPEILLALLLSVEDRNGNRLNYELPPGDARFFRGPDRVSDGLGRELRFTYQSPGVQDANPYLVRVEDQTGRAWTFQYAEAPADNPNPSLAVGFASLTLRSLTDPLGNTTTFQYADRDRIASETRPLGNVPFTQTYNPVFTSNGVVTSQTDAAGNATQIEADDFTSFRQRVEINGVETNRRVASRVSQFTVTFPDGGQQVFRHGKGSRVIQSFTDQEENEATFEADPQREQITKLTDRLGGTTQIGYHEATGKIAFLTNARGDTIHFTYTPVEQTFANPENGEQVSFAFHELTQIAYPDGTMGAFDYDGKGNLTSRTDAGGSTWTLTYNEQGRIQTITLPAAPVAPAAGAAQDEPAAPGVITSSYNLDGTLATSTDSDRGLTAYFYDESKRLIRIATPDGGVIQFAYDLNDQITAITDGNGNTTEYEYDANGNLTRLVDPLGNSILVAYDAMDRAIELTDRVGGVVKSGYDAVGRLESFTDPTGIMTRFDYDARGFLSQATLAGQIFQLDSNEEGVASSATTPMEFTTTFTTDVLGALTGLTDPLGQTTALTRDSLNRITAVTDPLNRTISYNYDNRGRLSGVNPPAVGSVNYLYDSLGLLQQITDLNGRKWSFTRTPMGSPGSLTDPLGAAWEHTYDNEGRLSETRSPDGVTQTLTYDAAGNLIRREYSDGAVLNYAVDALNRLTDGDGIQLTYDAEERVVDTDNDGVHFGASYDAAGRLQTVSYNNGAFIVTYTYDEETGLLTRVSDNLTGAHVEISYDDDLRPIGIARSNGVDTTLTWDAASRLIGVRDAGNESILLDLQYTLDAAGQVTREERVQPLDPADFLTAHTRMFTYDAASQLTDSGYGYDLHGRLTNSPGDEFSWDAASRLVRINGTTLQYNGLDQLVSRTQAGTTTHYYYNHAIGLNPIVAERDAGSGAFLRFYVWTPSGKLLYMIDAGNGTEVYFYHFDRLGSTLALTNTGGEVTDAYAYTPYGRLLARDGTIEQLFTFIGQFGVRAEGTGGTLYHMRARYYDAITSRFLSREPIWPQLDDPLQLNPYIYAKASPTFYLDVEGTDALGELAAFYYLGDKGAFEAIRARSFFLVEGKDLVRAFPLPQAPPPSPTPPPNALAQAASRFGGPLVVASLWMAWMSSTLSPLAEAHARVENHRLEQERRRQEAIAQARALAEKRRIEREEELKRLREEFPRFQQEQRARQEQEQRILRHGVFGVLPPEKPEIFGDEDIDKEVRDFGGSQQIWRKFFHKMIGEDKFTLEDFFLYLHLLETNGFPFLR